MNRKPTVFFIITMLCMGLLAGSVAAQSEKPDAADATVSSAFTYQGRLTDSGAPANGAHDFQFKLFDAASAGTQIGGAVTKDDVTVSGGLFVVSLNFGASFTGQALYLEIGVRAGSSSGAYTALSPRQSLTPAPYALAFGAPGGLYGYLFDAGAQGLYPTLGFNTYGASYLAGASGYGGILQFQNVDGKLIYYTGSNVAAGQAHANTPRLAILNNGNVGIGTTNPSASLSVAPSGATQPNAFGFPTGLKVGTPSGTIPLAVRQNVNESATPALAVFETSNGELGSFGANASTFVVGAATSHGLGFNVNGATRAMTINTGGDVGIGTTNPLADLDVNGSIRGTSLTSPANLFVNATGRIALRTAPSGQYAERVTILDNGNVGIGTTSPTSRLTVRGPDTSESTIAFQVMNSAGTSAFRVYDDGGVGIGTPYFYFNTSANMCHSNPAQDNRYILVPCGSAAEYVPSVASEDGYPETADLVSIVPNASNPYGDTHSPFVVEKSSTPCDDNLLGFIVDPKSGASGKQLNEHYLPLTIFGYFPAKVTLENGVIHRGDPLTSSSKPGYAMKATQACKIIGYALEAANAEGTIQVFANLSENSASEVASLRDQMKQLKKQNTALEARLAALEQSMSGQAPTQGTTPRDVVLFGALLIVGMVVGRRMDKRGSR